MNIKQNQYPYPSRRTAIYGKNGMAASGNPYASMAGIDVLKNGGNCVDAAIAMAMVHVVVEPTCNGLGSDSFAIVSIDDKLYGLNASGPAPEKLSLDYLKKNSYKEIPKHGPLTVDVPGAVGGWVKLHKRFGKMPFKELASYAIDYARNGFVVSPTISDLWESEVEKYSKYKNDKAFKGFFDTFTRNGSAPKAGEIFINEDIGNSLEEIAKTYGESFYKGELAEKISRYMGKNGGLLSKKDLENYQPEWVDPISINYKGYDIWELPPNTHGITVLMALKQFALLEKEKMTREARTHYAIESLKSAYVDTKDFVAEKSRMKYKEEELLSDFYAKERAGEISEKAKNPKVGTPGQGSTVYFCAADKDGNMISFIQSNYMGFGSGIVVENTGISLNNRVANFNFNEDHANSLLGGVRPYHTIIPGFISKDNKSIGPFGVMGGFMQPQGHMQVLLRMIDEGLNPQAALDAPRWQWINSKTIEIEEEYEDYIIEDLKNRGHDIKIIKDRTDMGRGEIILKLDNGVYIGGTEGRTDGSVLGI